MPSLRRSVPLLAIFAVAVVGVGAASIYGAGPLSGSGECRAARSVGARLAPLATGEVAALSVLSAPKPAPAIAFNGPDGRAITLASLNGKLRLVNIWATWCVPCRQEMPALDQLQAEFGGPDFEVVAVNVDTRNLERPRTWLQENGVTRLAYYADPSGKVMQVLQRSGELVGLPTSILVDRDGCQIAVLKGPAEWASADAKALIATALGRPAGS
jgi:thiol-disulfide isomerase/thioredoxin